MQVFFLCACVYITTRHLLLWDGLHPCWSMISEKPTAEEGVDSSSSSSLPLPLTLSLSLHTARGVGLRFSFPLFLYRLLKASCCVVLVTVCSDGMLNGKKCDYPTVEWLFAVHTIFSIADWHFFSNELIFSPFKTQRCNLYNAPVLKIGCRISVALKITWLCHKFQCFA